MIVFFFACWTLLAQDAAQTVSDFNLSDDKGNKILLSEESAGGGVVLVFIGTDCPVTQRYAPRLEALRQSFADRGIRFLGISSNVQDAPAQVARFAREFKLQFPLIKDVAGQVASALGAQRTPEVFLLDKDRRIRYRGRIDDQIDDEVDRSQPTRPDLEIAMEEVLAGRDVSVPNTRVSGCRIGRTLQESPNATVHWHGEIAKIFHKHCVTCHRVGGAAPFPMQRYEDVEGRAEMIREVVRLGQMPPWFAHGHEITFANDLGLSEQERSLVIKWVNDGSPRGDVTTEEENTPSAAGWQIASEPNQVFDVANSPVEIPAEGRHEYRDFLVDPQWKESRLVRGMEFKPSNRRIVWQAAVYVVPEGLASAYPNLRDLTSTSELDPNLLAWYSAGSLPVLYPEDIAREIPARSLLLFRLRYRPTGRPESDRTQFGLVWADKASVTRMVRVIPVEESSISITAESPAKEVSVSQTIDNNQFLLAITPKLSRLGRNFRLFWPPDPRDGAQRKLMEVDAEPYLWSHQYRLQVPLEIPSGTELKTTALFDRLSPAARKRGDIPSPDDADNEPPSEERLIAYLEVVPPPPLPLAAIPLPLLDPTQNISMAIAGLATTTAICVAFLWMKPSNVAPRPVDPPGPGDLASP
ncbi:redoxin domain-containing protein [bacterium]|nr:redoxin domain-containing protein [bacterium]